jgi:hypothetical protein
VSSEPGEVHTGYFGDVPPGKPRSTRYRAVCAAGASVVAVNFLMSYVKTKTLILFAVCCASFGAALISCTTVAEPRVDAATPPGDTPHRRRRAGRAGGGVC